MARIAREQYWEWVGASRWDAGETRRSNTGMRPRGFPALPGYSKRLVDINGMKGENCTLKVNDDDVGI